MEKVYIPLIAFLVLVITAQTSGQNCFKSKTVTQRRGSVLCPVVHFFIRSWSCKRTLIVQEPCEDGSENICTSSDKYLPNLLDSAKYWQCVDGKAVSKSCSTNGAKVWNQVIQSCIRKAYEVCGDVDSVFENPAECRSYYECKAGIRTVWLCPQGYKFQENAFVDTVAPHCAPGTCVNKI